MLGLPRSALPGSDRKGWSKLILDIQTQDRAIELLTAGVSLLTAAKVLGYDKRALIRFAARNEGFRDRFVIARREGAKIGESSPGKTVRFSWLERELKVTANSPDGKRHDGFRGKHTEETSERMSRSNSGKALTTPAHKEAALLCFLAGATSADAARFIGVSPMAMADALRMDPEFSLKRDEARAKCTMMLKNSILAAAQKGDWKAAAFWLSRKNRNEFGEESFRTQVDTSIKIQIEYSKRPPLIECESIGSNFQSSMLDSRPCLPALEDSTSSSADEDSAKQPSD